MEGTNDKVYRVEKISKSYCEVFKNKICSKSAPGKFKKLACAVCVCVCMKTEVSI